MSRIGFTILLVLWFLVPLSSVWAESPGANRPVMESFLSKGKRIRVERFEPKAAGRRPALVLLHGFDGLEGPGKHYRTIARQLANHGHVVLLVHYFDAGDTREENLKELRQQFKKSLDPAAGSDRLAKPVCETFQAWREAARDAVAHARKHPRVDPERIGMIGFSLGGFLATSVAVEVDLRIACVVELFGGIPCALAAKLEKSPPTLIIHGDKDQVVPIQQAHILRQGLQARKRDCEMKIYKDVGHCFANKNGGLAWESVLDAKKLILSFLSRKMVGRD